MKYLYDECVSCRDVFEGRNFIQSIDVVGKGATDEKVGDYAVKNNMLLITSDIKFALNMLIQSKPVIFKNGGDYTLIKPKTEKSRKYSDPITNYLLENDQVVIP